MNLMIEKLKQKLASFKFATQEKGAVAIEFALSLPIWVILLLGSSDIAYMMLISQRVDRVAYTVTDIVTQSETVTTTDLNSIVGAAGELMRPFTFGAKGVVIISSLYKPSGGYPTITWQHNGGGSLVRTSKIGTAGSTPVMPNGFVLNDNENVIVTEVYYTFDPMFVNAGVLSKSDIYRTAIYKPRLSPLITPPT